MRWMISIRKSGISIHALREEGDPAETGPRNFR